MLQRRHKLRHTLKNVRDILMSTLVIELLLKFEICTLSKLMLIVCSPNSPRYLRSREIQIYSTSDVGEI